MAAEFRNGKDVFDALFRVLSHYISELVHAPVLDLELSIWWSPHMSLWLRCTFFSELNSLRVCELASSVAYLLWCGKRLYL
jgi:hypothetical protein